MYEYYERRREREVAMFTDLAVERRRADTAAAGVEYHKSAASCGSWETVRITSDEGAKSIGRPKGTYSTLSLERMDNLDEEETEDAKDEVARKLCELCDSGHIVPARILVVGLGNPHLTPDSIGPRAADAVTATLQIMKYDEERFDELECSEIAVISPGVSAKSGLDAAEWVIGICERLEPDVIFAVDALASRSPNRLGRTVQISDTGIFPGSGVGNARQAISRESIGVPVIAIGVPTVMDSRHFSSDGILTGEPMFVSPREIDGIVSVGARIIGGAINQAFGLE